MDNNTITLRQWLDMMPDMEQKREMYLYGDMALNYLNDKGVIVESFDPADITLIDSDIKKIKFEKLYPSDDYNMLKDDLFGYAKLGIRMYLDYYDYLDDKFLKSKFNEFEFGLPQDDVNYFKGVIQRGSFVYFNEFDFELRKKKLKELDSEADPNDDINITDFKKPNNDNINSVIYDNTIDEITGFGRTRIKSRDAAFVEFMYYPVMVSLVVGVILLIAYCFFGLK